MRKKFSRRDFLSTTAAVGASLASARLLRGVPAGYSAAEKVHVGHIGATGKGRDDEKGVTDAGGVVVALCDVDSAHTAEAAHAYPNARLHTDFRKMLDEQKDIDAVCVSIPDHMHAYASIWAMERGKHVYCQKPLTHDIFEARQMREAAQHYKVATQMGNQGHGSEGLRTQVDWIKGGVPGAVREVHVWTDRPINWWPQGQTRPADTPPVPKGLDWDLWLGTAPQRPYNPAYHPFKWRGWWDFGTGALGDMGCHIIDVPFWGLELGGSCTVEAECEGQTEESGPLWSIVTWQFPARGELPPVTMKWYDGGKRPPKPEGVTDQQWTRMKSGSMIVGEKGTMCGSNQQRPNILGEYGKDLKPPPRTIPKSPGHYREWLDACKGGKPSLDNFDYASALTECVLLGNVAIRSGKKIEWDAKQFKAANALEANRFLKREYRKGWELPLVPA